MTEMVRAADVLCIFETNNLNDPCADSILYPKACGEDWDPDPGDYCDDYAVAFAGATPTDHAAHNGGNNWGFVDGHAQWVRPDLSACADFSPFPGTPAEIRGQHCMQRLRGIDQARDDMFGTHGS